MSYSPSFEPACNEPYLGPSLAQACPGSQFLVFMTILDTFVRAKREVSRLCERVIPADPADYYYDFIVVGGEYIYMYIYIYTNYIDLRAPGGIRFNAAGVQRSYFSPHPLTRGVVVYLNGRCARTCRAGISRDFENRKFAILHDAERIRLLLLQ